MEDDERAGDGYSDQGDTRADITAASEAAFEQVICYLRARAEACALPGGVGSFDVLYVNERELVVWLTPGREGQRVGEHAVPTDALALAWEALRAATVLDEPTAAELAGSRARGRWLLALLATLPGVRLDEEALIVRYMDDVATMPVSAPVTIPLAEHGSPPPAA